MLAGVWAWGLVGCASPGTGPSSSPAPLSPPSEAANTLEGVLTRKGNDPFLWWALQTDSGQVWQLELPPAFADPSLVSKQNCRVQARGHAAQGPLGLRLLRLNHLSGVQRPELGAPENLRCQFSIPAP